MTVNTNRERLGMAYALSACMQDQAALAHEIWRVNARSGYDSGVTGNRCADSVCLLLDESPVFDITGCISNGIDSGTHLIDFLISIRNHVFRSQGDIVWAYCKPAEKKYTRGRIELHNLRQSVAETNEILCAVFVLDSWFVCYMTQYPYKEINKDLSILPYRLEYCNPHIHLARDWTTSNRDLSTENCEEWLSIPF